MLQHDRSAINLHLMHTSYFLFVMVVMMMCYALVRGKPGSSSKPVQYTEVCHRQPNAVVTSLLTNSHIIGFG